MGQFLQEPQVRRQLDELHAESISAGEQLKKAMVGAEHDLVGVFDPTPVSDCLGALRSAAQGDWVGAALSVVSAVPYAGDMIGKTAKGARAASISPLTSVSIGLPLIDWQRGAPKVVARWLQT